MDPEETMGVQEERIEYFKIDKWTDISRKMGRGTEITRDLVLHARAKMLGNKVNGQEDAIVSEMIKQLLRGNCPHHKLLLEAIFGAGGGAKLLENREAHLFAETRGIRQKIP